MTAMTERASSQLSVDMFERIAEFAEREDETVRFEFIDGRIDGVLAPVDHFVGQGEWADPRGVLMAVEITSYDSDTHKRDRIEKPRAYAEAGIPVYLLIDRDNLSILVHSDPDVEDGYRDIHVVRLGGKVTLPDPVGIELDTEDLKQYVD